MSGQRRSETGLVTVNTGQTVTFNAPAEADERTPLGRWRLAHGLSLDEVADLTGLSKSMLSRVERGQRDLAALTKVKVARSLGVPIREIFPVPKMADEDTADRGTT